MAETEKTMEDFVKELREVKEKALLGGGQDKIDKEHAKGKLTARERIDLLLDPGSFREWGMLVGHSVGAPGDGISIGWGTIEGRQVCIFAHDTTVFGGSQGYKHGRKLYKIHELALTMGVPIICLHDSPGARVIRPEIAGMDDPYRVDDEKHAGVVFNISTRCSGVIPQISGVMGSCTGGSVYSPALTDFIFMVDGISHMCITGPRVIKSVLSEDISLEDLAGSKVHAAISGCADFRMKTEQECMQGIKALLRYLPSNWKEKPPYVNTGDDPGRYVDTLEGIVPTKTTRPYDMHRVIKEIVDNGEFLEVKREFAREIVVGFGRLDGNVVGFVGNNPAVLAGSMSINSSDKQARFIRFCDAFNIPLVLLVDSPGYLPGKDEEYGGIIRHGAKVLYALSEATVPRVAILMRKIYGGATIGMGIMPGFGTDFVYAWPTAEIGPMGAAQAVKLIYRKEIASAENPEEFEAQKTKEYRDLYANALSRTSDCTWISECIEPRDTRRYLVNTLGLLKSKDLGPLPQRKHGNIPL